MLPTIQQGTRWEDTSATAWNELFDSVRRMSDELQQLKPAINAISSAGFATITARVVVVEAPVDGDPIIVRPVRYIDTPPSEFAVSPGGFISDGFEFSGETLETWPDYGLTASDFDPHLWTDEETATLGDGETVPKSATVLVARQVRDFWVLELPESSIVSIKEFQSWRGRVFSDSAECFAIGSDGNPITTTIVKVALPYELRKSPFHGKSINGKFYRYKQTGTISDNQRTVFLGGTTGPSEDQIITPSYYAGSRIFAVNLAGRTGVANSDWLELNIDGRAWAMESQSTQ